MRRNELAQFVAPEREAVVPELGGDGRVIVRTVPFGTKLAIARLPTDGQQACALAAATVLDDAGEPLMDAAAWEQFSAVHEDRFLDLLAIAKEVTGLDGQAKKA